MSTHKVIIDTDPGVDDCIALFMAMASPNIDILGITTVNGNVKVEQTEYNARRICEYAWHSGIKVFQGCDRPLKRSVLNAEWIHGEDGLAGQDFGEPANKKSNVHAVDFIIDTIMSSTEREVSIIAIGPLTNIATAFLKEPKIISRINELVIMAGGFNEFGPRGNTTPYAEFNVYADPHAAEIVFNLGQRITILPMEVGQQVYADQAYINKLRDMNLRCAKMAANLLEETAKKLTPMYDKMLAANISPELGTSLYDPCAIACLVRPELFSGKYGSVSVNTDARSEKFGMTSFLAGEKRNCLVTYKADKEAFLAFVLEHFKLLS